MTKKEDLFQQAFKVLEQDGKPTECQKDRMFDNIMMECEKENVLGIEKIKQLVVTYPWRVAFATSAVQAVVLTMIFGARYTNLFVGFFGG